jgi:hypothetical protein
VPILKKRLLIPSSINTLDSESLLSSLLLQLVISIVTPAISKKKIVFLISNNILPDKVHSHCYYLHLTQIHLPGLLPEMASCPDPAHRVSGGGSNPVTHGELKIIATIFTHQTYITFEQDQRKIYFFITLLSNIRLLSHLAHVYCDGNAKNAPGVRGSFV